jgi:hypothetical protein
MLGPGPPKYFLKPPILLSSYYTACLKAHLFTSFLINHGDFKLMKVKQKHGVGNFAGEKNRCRRFRVRGKKS